MDRVIICAMGLNCAHQRTTCLDGHFSIVKCKLLVSWAVLVNSNIPIHSSYHTESICHRMKQPGNFGHSIALKPNGNFHLYFQSFMY